MAKGPTFAAGGIVMRTGTGAEPLIAIVQLRKDNSWMLPKGKLNKGEHVAEAAKREVMEETGHDVALREFLGTMSYEASSKPKIVQFWRMQANEEPVRRLMRDVRAVEWLPLEKAIKKLTHPRERVFLASVGPIALKAAADPSAASKPLEFVYPEPHAGLVKKAWTWLRGRKG
jgi:8-oxo-dGTP diphosphatase